MVNLRGIPGEATAWPNLLARARARTFWRSRGLRTIQLSMGDKVGERERSEGAIDAETFGWALRIGCGGGEWDSASYFQYSDSRPWVGCASSSDRAVEVVEMTSWSTVDGRRCEDCRHAFVDPAFTVVRVLSCRSPKVTASNSGIPRACSVARAPIGVAGCGPKAKFWEKAK